MGDILNYIKEHPSAEGVTISEISRELGIVKSGVHRMLDTLIAYKFVEKSSDSSTSYRLGWGLYQAGNAVPKQHITALLPASKSSYIIAKYISVAIITLLMVIIGYALAYFIPSVFLPREDIILSFEVVLSILLLYSAIMMPAILWLWKGCAEAFPKQLTLVL